MKSSSLRILHLLNDVSDKGSGIVNAAIDIACGQVQVGHTVAVASAGYGYENLLPGWGVTHYILNQQRRPVSLLKAAQRFRQIIREFNPDIVHCHMMTGVVLARLLRSSARFRLVSHINNVHQRSSMLMGLAERVIPVSDAVDAYMSQQGVPKRKMRVVPNLTLGSARLPPIDACAPAVLKQPAIVTVAGMNQRKGIAELICAFEQVANRSPDVNLYLVGDGADRQTFETQASASPFANRIHFEGFKANPLPYMQAAYIFVLASRRESFGIVLVEARQAGCAIIASNVDGIPEALDYGAAGMLVPPKDVTALAKAMERLLANPPEHAKWKRSARQNLERLTIDNMVKQVDVVYRELLDST